MSEGTIWSKALAVLAGTSLCMAAVHAQYPNSIAGLGDSITRATLADNSIGGLDYGQPQHAWSTGYEANDGVYSHYERVRDANPGINGNTYNLANSGARMNALPGQAVNAVNVGAEYVVIQMGGNDLCRDHANQMTPVSQFAADFDAALGILQAGLPDSVILATQTVRVKRVYDVGRWDFWCQLKWATFTWCDSALRNGSTQRNQVDARNIEYNNAMAAICAQRGVPYDTNVFSWPFTKGNLSEIDCFHPDKSGQNSLANVTYNASRF